MRSIRAALLLAPMLLAGCGSGDRAGADPATAGPSSESMTASLPRCDPDDGGIVLPDGFCALVVTDAELVGRARLRHIAVDTDGDLYVAVQGSRDAESHSERGGILALRDTTGDGRADVSGWFGPSGGTGVEIREGHLYFATNDAVLRYRLGAELVPEMGPDTLVTGLPAEHSHTAKSLAFGDGGAMFVNIGSPTNACQPIGRDRERGLLGEDPCPQLDTRAGVWRFSAASTGQTLDDAERWATGIRNAVALAWNPADRNLYAVQHGRDQLDFWPGFDAEDNAEGPAEELQRLTRGADFGWPYCYYDTRLNRRVLAPEYGGDGEEVGRCAAAEDPLIAFPGHWAPNDLLFYSGDHFPRAYRGGAFIAFHGSWNRAPQPQAGYRVVFVPFSGGAPGSEWSTFADGFAGGEIASPGDADHRPMGLAEGPDGTLYITDSAGGRIWRVVHGGAVMETVPVRTPERCCMVEVTRELREIARRSGVSEGVLVAQSLHTTGGLTINENADPDVVHDLVRKLGELVPEREGYYMHAEGNSDSHLKTTLCGPSLSVIVSGGDLVLGRWQGIYFCEWDGPRSREVAVQVVAVPR